MIDKFNGLDSKLALKHHDILINLNSNKLFDSKFNKNDLNILK